jgi:hypothetical protein
MSDENIKVASHITSLVIVNVYVPTAATANDHTEKNDKKRSLGNIKPDQKLFVSASNDTTDDHADHVDNHWYSCCPFCEFELKTDGKSSLPVLLRAHLSRFHGDAFHFAFFNDDHGDDEMMTVDATVRNPFFQDGCLRGTPRRTYYHTRGGMPYEDGQYDRDSDDESTYSWYVRHREHVSDKNHRLTEHERKLFQLWNSFVLQDPRRVGCDTQKIPGQCMDFVDAHAEELRDLELEFYFLMCRLWEMRRLSGLEVQKLVYHYEKKCQPGLSVRAERPNREIPVVTANQGEEGNQKPPALSVPSDRRQEENQKPPALPAQSEQPDESNSEQPRETEPSRTQQDLQETQQSQQGTEDDPIILE